MPRQKTKKLYLSALLKLKKRAADVAKANGKAHYWLSFGKGKLLTSETFTREDTAEERAEHYTKLMVEHLEALGYVVYPPLENQPPVGEM